MASRTRSGAALQTEVKTLRAQLLHAQEVSTINAERLADKNALIAAKNSELQSLRLLAASQAQQLAAERASAAELDSKRARLDDSWSPLERDEILDTVFSYVGIEDYIYTGAVSRRWKGRYTKLCYSVTGESKKHKLITAHKSALFTAARLQLALKSSLTMSALQRNTRYSFYMIVRSKEPMAVLTLARVLGLQWLSELCKWAACRSNLQLLQWLHECGCPWKERDICRTAACTGNVDMLIWLQQVTAPWSSSRKRKMLFEAGQCNHMSAVKWLRQQGAEWPFSFTAAAEIDYEQTQVCWAVPVVRWALDNGCAWRNWQCDQLDPELYTSKYRKWQASKLFVWAHENGCPCTCDECSG
jgi:hypothetical protein